MTIKKVTATINASILLLVCLMAFFVFWVHEAVQENDKAHEQQEILSALALELQQSSEELTRQVRIYAATGDPEAEQKYLAVVAERAGNIPRLPQRKVAAGERIPLQNLLQRHGITAAEFAKIQQANDLSDGLIRLETQAMEAVKGRYKDAKGRDIVGESNKALALQLVFSPAYAGEVRKIMAPLQDFFTMLDTRMDKELASSNQQVRYSIFAVIAALLATLTLCLVSFYYNHRYVTKPLGQTVDYAQRVIENENTAPLHMDNTNEVGVLVRVLNVLLAKLQKELLFSRQVLTALPVACAVFDHQDKVVFMNNSMLHMLGLQERMENYLGLSSGELVSSQQKSETLTVQCLRERQAKKAKLEYTNSAGTIIHLESIASPLFDPQGKLGHVLVMWLDVSEIVSQKNAIEKNQQVILGVAADTVQVVDAAKKISDTLAQQIARSRQATEATAQRMSDTATAMSEMNGAVLEVAQNASTAAVNTEEMRNKAVEGSAIVARMVGGIQQVHERALGLSNDINHLSELAQGINTILVVISDIADQTNLLALNAAIEAARAGDAGRGFAVVADEVRKLAEKTMSATTEVSTLINSIQADTTRNVNTVKASVQAIQEVNALASSSGTTLEEILSLAKLAADMVSAIAIAAEQQSASSTAVSDSVEVVSEATQQISSAMIEAHKGMGELETQIQRLLQLVNTLEG